jgi:AraC-like DNA-binding protein
MSEALNIRWTFLQSAAAEIMSAAIVEHRFDEHFHDTWAMGCIDRGACAFTVAGKAHTASAGELVVLPPYTVHTGGTGDSELAYRMAYVREQWLASLSQLVLGASHVAFPAVVIHDPETARLLSAALSPASKPYVERRASLAHALVSLLARHASPRPGGAARISLGEIRDRSGLLRTVAAGSPSRSALIHRFTRRFGLSPRRYERNLRCVSAKVLLRQGMPIVEVAQALDFADQAHFTREFKKVHHITPGGYCRLLKASGRAVRASERR